MTGYEVKQHFVKFYSPGTFVAETTQRSIDDWDVDEAVKIADTITERHASKPYCFEFLTRARGSQELDSQEIATSGRYFLDGIIETVEDVRANQVGRPSLVYNMEMHGWDRVVTTLNPWQWSQPFRKGDVLIRRTRSGNILERAELESAI